MSRSSDPPASADVPFGDRLRALREAAGLTQEELAERAGLSRDAISALERGRRRHPHVHTIRAMAEALALSEHDHRSLRLAAQRRAAPEPAAPVPAPARPVSMPESDLIGRTRERLELRERLLSGVRLLTLTGPAGVGKTRLAQQIARDMADDFPEPAAFIPLAPVHDPALVIPTIADALGVRDQGNSPLTTQVHHALRDRRVLLILDNLEHLRNAFPEIGRLLAFCPGLTMLVTSQTPLRLSAEHEYPLAPLAVPRSGSHHDPVDLAANEAVALFVQRARAVQPGFSLTNANATAIAGICARLDGLPLAIELAAARIKVLPPPALLARLTSRLDLLAGGPRDRSVRLQSLRAAIAWSYELLSPDERRLHQRLAVFADSFSLDAAEAVADPTAADLPVLDLIASLVDKNLIRALDSPSGEPRFGMLQTIHEFALEQLAASGDRESARGFHAAWYLHLADRAYRAFRKRSGQERWLNLLEMERGNLREALAWFTETGDDESLIDLAGSLYWFWYARGPLSEGRTWLDRALAVEAPGSPDVSRIRALVGAGLLAHFQGDEAEARARLEASLADPAGHPDRWLQAYALFLLGIVSEGQGDYSLAEVRFQDAFALFQEVGDRSNASIALAHLGVTAYGRGDGDRGMALCDEAAAQQRVAGDTWGLGISLGYLGLIASDHGALARSAAAYRECLEVSWQIRVPADIAGTLEDLAGLAVAVGQPEQAARFIGAAAAIRSAADRPSPNLPERAVLERTLAGTRDALGAVGFARASADGGELSLAAAVSEALAFLETVAKR